MCMWSILFQWNSRSLFPMSLTRWTRCPSVPVWRRLTVTVYAFFLPQPEWVSIFLYLCGIIIIIIIYMYLDRIFEEVTAKPVLPLIQFHRQTFTTKAETRKSMVWQPIRTVEYQSVVGHYGLYFLDALRLGQRLRSSNLLFADTIPGPAFNRPMRSSDEVMLFRVPWWSYRGHKKKKAKASWIETIL